MKNYRPGFLRALIGNIAFAGVLAGFWWHSRAAKSAAKAESQPSSAAAQVSAAGSKPASPAPTETPLVPVQLSPQRLQSIGVKTGQVERRPVEDEIRVTGNVAVDETRLAYVHGRFSAYLQKGFADATYQYFAKGQT